MIKFDSIISEKIFNIIKAGLFYFLIYGLIGWLIDSIFDSLVFGYLVLGGMFRSFLLPIPFAPIYGFGALVLISFKKIFWNKSPWIILPTVGVIINTIEYFGGVLTLLVLGRRAWDYSGSFANLHGHINLLHGILWMFLGYAFIKIIHPHVEKIAQKYIFSQSTAPF